jgi:hypothetical protein
VAAALAEMQRDGVGLEVLGKMIRAPVRGRMFHGAGTWCRLGMGESCICLCVVTLGIVAKRALWTVCNVHVALLGNGRE